MANHKPPEDRDMDYRDKIICAISEAQCQHIADSVISILKSMTEGMQSGDETPLANIWEEICVQVQGETSSTWEMFIETIHQVVISNIKNIPAYFK